MPRYGSADIHKAITNLWYGIEGLDQSFTNLWASGVTKAEYTSLHDTEASSNQPWPYCVFELSPGITRERFTDGINGIRETRDVPLQFRVHAKAVSGDSRTAKEIAADLAAQVIKAYGGHPTEPGTDLNLDTGNFLINEYQTDYGVRTGDDEYMWIVDYLFRIDIPVAVSSL